MSVNTQIDNSPILPYNPPMPINADFPRGIDVSNHQGEINWRQVVDSGISFVFIKATEGISYTDPRYGRNHGGAKTVGLLRGAYHYLRGQYDPLKQAKQFLHVHGEWQPGDLQPVVDVEMEGNVGVSRQGMIDHLARYIFHLEALSGKNVIIYSYPDYWINYLGNPDQFSAHNPLWIAHYSVKKPRLVGAWGFWSFWQYSSSGACPGIVGNVDLDYFNGTPEALRRFAGIGTVYGDA